MESIGLDSMTVVMEVDIRLGMCNNARAELSCPKNGVL